MLTCLHLQKLCLCSIGSEWKERGLGAETQLLQLSRHRGYAQAMAME